MSRKVQTAMCSALILCCIHPEPGLAQSQKSQIWQVPVLPKSSASDESKGSVISPLNPTRSRRLEQMADPLEADLLNPGERILEAENVSTLASASELWGRLGILSTGSESGRWAGGRLSLRGRPGTEPTVSVGGVLLSSGYSGAHAEDLIPLVSIAQVRVFPFFPAWGLPRVGVGGGYDLKLVSGPAAWKQESIVFVESPWASGGASRVQTGCCLQVSWASGFFRGQQTFRDDANTPQNSSDDRTTTTKLNDASRISAAAHYRHDFSTGTQTETAVIAGAEGRAAGPISANGVPERQRILRDLFFVSQEISHLSPASGWLGVARLSGRRETGRFSQSLQNALQQTRADLREEDFLAAQAQLSIPTSAGERPHRWSFFVSSDKSQFEGTTSVSQVEPVAAGAVVSDFQDSVLSGKLTQTVLGTGIALEMAHDQTLKIETSQHWAVAKLSRVCGVFAPTVLCAESEHETSQNSNTSMASWRYRGLHPGVLFVQLGRLSRPPTPVELAGRPDGILASPALKPESTDAVEWGYESQWGVATVFYAHDRDLITAEQVNPFMIRYENTSEVRRFGLNLEGEFMLYGFAISAQAETMSTQLLRGRPDQKVITFVPNERLNFSVAKTIDGILFRDDSVDHLKVLLEFTRSGDYWLDAQGVARLSPPPVVNFRVSQVFSHPGGPLDVSFSVRNLLDHRQSILHLHGQSGRPVFWSDSPSLPIQGRAFELTLRLLKK